MIRIDTHVAIWLWANRPGKLTATGRRLIDHEDVIISPIVEFEIQVLHEVGKVGATGGEVVRELTETIGAHRSSLSTENLVHFAHRLDWTRDPFDRLIAADAIATKCLLLTADATIRRHCELAVW